MKVLFISSGRSGDVGDVVKNQGTSLVKAGISITYFAVKPGFGGYLASVRKLRKLFRQGSYDLAHAHYGLSGFIAALAGCSPLVVSLMGSDIYYSWLQRVTARFFYRFIWNATIVKSQQMRRFAGMKESLVIPNGVDLERFVPMSKSAARKHLELLLTKKIILFIGSPGRYEKNLDLAEKAVEALDSGVELKCIHNVPNSEIPYYLNASDVLLLTSRWEGSVNVIKEAMACNAPVVATKAGDAEWVLGDLPGHFHTGYNVEDVTSKILSALQFSNISGKTEGRRRILQLGLDSDSIAQRIIRVYKHVTDTDEGIN